MAKKMKPKMNCQDGLDRKQELEARRLKDRLINGNREVFNRVEELQKKWIESKQYDTFEEFFKAEDIVLYSAYKRYKKYKE